MESEFKSIQKKKSPEFNYQTEKKIQNIYLALSTEYHS